MRLRSLELRNYRRYTGHHEIAFGEGIVGLLGPNGAGKSTLIEALAWAFYGQPAARTPAEGLRSSGVAESEPVSVAVEFTLANDNYRVVRTLKGKNLTPEALFFRGNLKLAEGAKDVSGVVARRLGLDWRSFYTTIFTRQKELDAFSALTPAERKGMVERLLGISLLDDVVKNVREVSRNRKGRLEDRRTKTLDEEGRPRAEMWLARKEELQELQARLAEERADLQKAVKVAIEAQTKAEAAWKAVQQQKESHHTIKRQVTRAKAQAEAAGEGFESTQQRLTELKAQEKELARIEPRLAQLKPAKEALATHERAREQVNQRTRLEKEREGLSRQQKKRTAALEGIEKGLATKPDPAPQLQRLASHKEGLEKTAAELQQRVADQRGALRLSERRMPSPNAI